MPFRNLNLPRAAFLLLALTSTSLAAPYDEGLRALLSGQPDVAVNLLKDQKDAPSLAVLARAYVGQSLFVKTPEEKKPLFAASEAAARASLAIDANNAEAHIELANALALQLQGVGVVKATQTGLEIKRLFEQAAQLDPKQARAWLGLGVWHAQALSLGSFVAFASGASETTMRQDHRRAIELDPNEVFYRLSYADSLLLLAKSNASRATALKQEARSILQNAAALKPQTYWQRYDSKQVQTRLKELGGG
ncbi:hypothetical protein [Deinococcus sp.]|uniref:hypothetical protein n=1 Tax=Deinococcus sp. TaxID=47478 RepID=UPI003B5B1715